MRSLLRDHRDPEMETRHVFWSLLSRNREGHDSKRKKDICIREPLTGNLASTLGISGPCPRLVRERQGKRGALDVLCCSSALTPSPPIPVLVLRGSVPHSLTSQPNPPILRLDFRIKSELKEGKKEIKERIKWREKRKVRQMGDKRVLRKTKTLLNT